MAQEFYPADATILRHAASALQAGRPVWLGTVLATYGSSPRPPGSLWAWSPTLGMAGSLSGGCVEEDLLQRLQQGQFGNSPARLSFGVSHEEQQRYRLPCGGVLDILLEPLTSADLTHLLQMCWLLEERLPFVREHTGEHYRLAEPQPGEALLSLHKQGFRRVFQPQWQLLLVGAGEVARQLAQLAQPAGFEVTLCDHREAFLQGFDVPGVHIARCQPDQLIARQFQDKQCAIVTLAHDPRLDDLALLEAFNTTAYYLGAMGSLRTSASRRQRLQELGISAAQLQRLHAPVGLDIGSKTPYEIALSILVHLLQQRPQTHSSPLC